MKLNDYATKTKLPKKFLAELGVKEEDGKLITPYFYTDGTHVRDRIRKGNQRWWSKGESVILYGLWKHGNGTGKRIFLTEGESDCQTLLYHGYEALGVPGSQMFKPEYVQNIKNYAEVCLCPDFDEGGKNFAISTVRTLNEGGHKGQITVVYQKNGVKDINELHCKDPLVFKREFELLVEDSLTITASSSIYTNSDDGVTSTYDLDGHDHDLPIIRLCDVVPEETQFLVDKFLPLGYTTTLFGAGGQGKSYLALTIAISVAAGKDFLNKKVVKGNVLYLDFELSEEEQSTRAYRISFGLGLDRIPEGLQYLAPGITEKVPLRFEDLIAAVKKVQKERDIKLIVIDSFGAALQGDSESAKDVCRLFQKMRGLETVLMIDHQSKLGKNEKYSHKSPFGSVYKTNLSRNVFQIQSIANEPGEVKVILHHKKSNFTSLNNPIGLRFTFGSEFKVEESDIFPEFMEHLSAEQQVLNAFKELKKATAEDVAEYTGLELGTVRNKITALKSSKKIVDTGENSGRASVYAVAN